MSEFIEPEGTRRTVTDRTLELLRSTSSSVQVHLEQVEGWLKLARLPGEPDFWKVDVVTGPIGALADTCGRLTLLSRVTGMHGQVEGELNSVMDGLAGLLTRLLSGDVGDDEVDQIERLSQIVQTVYRATILDLESE